MTLHDGSLSENDWFSGHSGEVVNTTVKVHNGGHAEFNESFVLNKPGIFLNFLLLVFVLNFAIAVDMRVLRVGLEDSTMIGIDNQLGV